MAFSEVGESKSLERSCQQKSRTVEHKLAFDTNVELSPVLFELPSVKAATVGRQAKIEAVVVRQVLWRLRALAPSEVGGRAYHGHPQVGANSNGYHILFDKLARPDACIHLLRHYVSQPIIDHDLYANIRVLRQDPRQGGKQDFRSSIFCCSEANSSSRRFAELAQHSEFCVHIVELGAYSHGLQKNDDGRLDGSWRNLSHP